jgi:hypothetical protein
MQKETKLFLGRMVFRPSKGVRIHQFRLLIKSQNPTYSKYSAECSLDRENPYLGVIIKINHPLRRAVVQSGLSLFCISVDFGQGF